MCQSLQISDLRSCKSQSAQHHSCQPHRMEFLLLALTTSVSFSIPEPVPHAKLLQMKPGKVQSTESGIRERRQRTKDRRPAASYCSTESGGYLHLWLFPTIRFGRLQVNRSLAEKHAFQPTVQANRWREAIRAA
jgi:hypothetical protein